MVMDLAGWPCFFVGAAMGPVGWPYFRFIRISVVGIGLGEADSLAIGGVVSTVADIIVGFSGLSSW